MAKKQTSKRRTRVKDLPAKEKKLSKSEQKKVKGGQVGVSPENRPTESMTLNLKRPPLPKVGG